MLGCFPSDWLKSRQRRLSFPCSVVPVPTKSSIKKRNLNFAFASPNESLNFSNSCFHFPCAISVASKICSLLISPEVDRRKTSIRAPSLNPKNRHLRRRRRYSCEALESDHTK